MATLAVWVLLRALRVATWGGAAATLCVGLAQRGQRRGQEGRGENAQGGQAAQQGTQEGEDFQEEGQEGPRGQGNSDHVR